MYKRVSRVAKFIACLVVPLLAACSDSNNNGTRASGGAQEHAVGITSIKFTDTSRTTAAHGSVPESASRALDTTIVYPAQGAPTDAVSTEAPVATSGAPYPLVVLSHGLGGTVEYLLPLAEVWASRGYVVALPKFPLTNFATVGGPVAQDVQNQPADVSFVIDEMLSASASSGELLSDAIDGGLIAVSGHSNGGITTYGLIANSCCRDQRIGAAVVLSGAVSPFAGGTYDLSNTPPTLVVHGVNDDLTNYNQAVRDYNQILPPKALLTLETATHGSYLASDDEAFAPFTQVTADFLDGELRGDSEALARLPEHQLAGVASVHWAPDDASNTPVATLPEPETNRQAFISADTDLVDGQVITVTWSGFLPGKVVNLMQCSGDVNGGAAACNISGGKILYPDPEGMGSLELVIHTGPIGNGVCDSAHPCTVLINDASLTEEAAIIRMPITFAAP